MDEKYLMEYNSQTGEIKGFYPKSMLGMYKEMPSIYVEIDEEKHQFYMNNQGKYTQTQVQTCVNKGYITQVQANTILATLQVSTT